MTYLCLVLAPPNAGERLDGHFLRQVLGVLAIANATVDEGVDTVQLRHGELGRLLLRRACPTCLGRCLADKIWIDGVVERWSKVHPDFDMKPYLVTGRISPIAAHIARMEEAFGPYGMNRGEVGVLSALRMVGPPQKLSPTQLFKGLMLSSAAMKGRLDNLEDRGLVTRSPDPADRRGVIVS